MNKSTLSNANQVADELGCTSSCRMLEQGVAHSKASVFGKMRLNKEHEDELLVEQKKVSDNVSCDFSLISQNCELTSLKNYIS